MATVKDQTPIAAERELPMLAGIGAFVTWCEDLLNILSGPVITAGLAIALVALLTDGDLLVRIPAMIYVWAASMALGLDAQFVGSAAKMARAVRQRRYWAVFGYSILCAALGYVGFVATYVFAFQEANGITTAQALERLGMDSTTWIFQRSILAVVLVFLSGFLRYVAPAKDVAVSTAEQRAKLEQELELAPLRAQVQAAKLRGMRENVNVALGRTNGQKPATGLHAVGAAYGMPEPSPEAHVSYDHYRAMHDGYEGDEYGITNEVSAEDEESTYATRTLPEVREARPSHPKRTPKSSGPRARNFDDFDGALADDEDDDYDTHSRHQRKNGKTATGRKTQRQRTALLAREAVEKQQAKARNHVIDQAVDAVMRATNETGEELSGYQLEDRVNDYLARIGSQVRTSRKTVEKRKRIWIAAHRGPRGMTIDSAPIIADDIVEMLASERDEEREEALV